MTDIYLDMDGVLTDFVGACLREFDSEAKAKGLTQEKVDRWNIEQLLGVDQRNFWLRISSIWFWADMKPYPWAMALFKTCRKHGRVVLLTSPGDCPGAACGKMLWVQHHLPDTQLIMTKDKTHCAQLGRILIDDSDKNCEAWNHAGGDDLIFPQYWNRARGLRALPHYDPVAYITRELENLPC